MVNDIIHPLNTSIQPPKQFTNPFRYTPHPLCLEAMKEVQRHLQSTPIYDKEIAMGKLFGVLVVKNKDGVLGFLAAFSGLLCATNDLPYFVPAIYDILNPECRFKQGERQLDEINRQIREMEHNESFISLKKECEKAMQKEKETLQTMRLESAEKKEQRHRLRAEGNLTAEEEQQLIKQSQFEKAEIKRVKDAFERTIAETRQRIEATEQQILSLKKERKELSDSLQRWIFNQFVVLNAKGQSKNLTDIFADETGTLPPAGAGECAAPKLLQYAFINNLTPLCMAEFWWGKSPETLLRRHLNCYPACSGKCKPILHFMLQGLDVENSLSDTNNPDSPDRMGCQSYNGNCSPYVVHRLDMDTSGLLIFAKDKQSQQVLQAQFANHKVQKRYKAVVEGDISIMEGDISLPLRPDIMDRPRQMVDLIQEVGFLPLLYSGISGFSAEEAVDDDCRYVVYSDGGWDWPMWKWKGPIVTEGSCVYGKFFNKKAGYISMDWWPDFMNYRRHTYPTPAPGSIEEAILLTLREHGSLITRAATCAACAASPAPRCAAASTAMSRACRWPPASSPRTLSIPATSTNTSTAGDGPCSPRPSSCWARKPATATARPSNPCSA